MIKSEPVNYIDLETMKKMCHPIAVALFDSGVEPISRFEKHQKDLLESALQTPQQTFGGEDLYRTLSRKAAVLYYGMIKNHPFENGNKRTATATLLVFLFINGMWLYGNQEEIENYLVLLAARVANTAGSDGREEFLNEIDHWLVKNMRHQPKDG